MSWMMEIVLWGLLQRRICCMDSHFAESRSYVWFGIFVKVNTMSSLMQFEVIVINATVWGMC